MADKQDYIGVCNDQRVPEEDFRLSFCDRCFQRECSRSRYGTSKFDHRVHTWEERLFNAPQLPKTDPRWQLITAKKFLTISSGPPPAVREWIDPRSLDVAQPAIQVSTAPAVPSPPPVAVKSPEPPPAPTSQKATPPAVEAPVEMTPAPPPPEPPKKNLLVNTPYAGPITLPNQPTNSEKPRDAWAGPVPLKPNERVITPGGKVKIGRQT